MILDEEAVNCFLYRLNRVKPQIEKNDDLMTVYGLLEMSVLNASGQDFSQEQREAWEMGLKVLFARSVSFPLTMENAFLLCEDLEDAGLNGDPPGFGALADFLCSEDVAEVMEKIEEDRAIAPDTLEL